MKKKIYYFGGFPPPYGGVTIKNKLLTDALAPSIPLALRDTRKAKRNPLRLVAQSLRLAAGKGPFVIANSKSGRRKLTMLLARLNPKALEKSLLIVMGGSIAEDIAGDDAYIRALKSYRRIFVELEAMAHKLRSMGFENISVYPNCRKDNRVKEIRKTPENGVKCLFFSLICKEKGVDNILEAARACPGHSFTFYGDIQEDYRQEFLAQVEALPNCVYRGVFASDGVNVYSELHSYDLLLLPTRYATEGIPGVLIEAKIAALAAIVSDVSYNRYLIHSGVSGLVLQENTAQALTQALQSLTPQAIDSLKQGALQSAQSYLIENNLREIQSYLR